jgi:hypothetical protein
MGNRVLGQGLPAKLAMRTIGAKGYTDLPHLMPKGGPRSK